MEQKGVKFFFKLARHMQQTLFIRLFSKYIIELLPLLLTTLFIMILSLLGLWQLSRLNEKNLFISRIKTNLNNGPIGFSSFDKDTLYSKIKVSGYFLSGKDIYLYGRRSATAEKDGYYLLTPFKTDNDKIIIIERGWFSQSAKNIIATISNDLHEEIIGIALPSEKKNLFVPTNNIDKNIWFTLDLDKLSNVLDLKLEMFYLLQTDTPNLPPPLQKLSAHKLVNIRNDHLEYAITWFSLAICLAIIFVIYHIRKHKESA